ncbi:MAG: DUF4249 domain-containing protein [Imperialibacter sp.]|uniref:DUF4249 domain-containing protein n=1 Tax=Imperialibacter sp. TaxID=2038411 RepID=UPI0032EFF4C6
MKIVWFQTLEPTVSTAGQGKAPPKSGPTTFDLMIIRKLSYGPLFTLVLLAGCIEPFSLDIERVSNQVIVEAILSNHPELQSVKLRQTPNDPLGFIELEGAIVKVENSNGIKFSFSEASAGTYYPTTPIEITNEEKYRLLVDLGDSMQIVSNWQSVPPPLKIETAYVSPTIEQSLNDNGYLIPYYGFSYYVTSEYTNATSTFVRYSYQSAYIMESPMRSSLCWDCTGCYIVSNAKDFIKTAFVENGSRKRLSNYQIAFINSSYEYSIKKTLRIFQHSINEDTYEYYATIEQQKNLKGTIFDPPPAIAKTNLKDVRNPERAIYGFFEVNSVDEASVSTNGNSAPFAVRTFDEICTPYNLYTNPQCADCRVKEGATNERPAWF